MKVGRTPDEVRAQDLLGRPEIEADLRQAGALVSGETVLVTGGAGSIGSELTRLLLALGAARVVAFDFSENSLFELLGGLPEETASGRLVPFLGSVRDAARLSEAFDRFRPRLVLHAAAHKHVPMMERSPGEALINNVLGTKNTADAAVKSGSERFLLISTDKAVNPTSVMGTTKRVAELLVGQMNGGGGTRFASVRFGNVLDSSGSVVPVFRRQIRAGGPLTVTHPEASRYFMTIPEAARLVLEAAAMAEGGEIYLLDMGKPVRIYELAETMIRLCGLEPGRDIAIGITGLRPGEKLSEELSAADEDVIETGRDRILELRERRRDGNRPSAMDRLLDDLQKRNFADAWAQVRTLVPDCRCTAFEDK